MARCEAIRDKSRDRFTFRLHVRNNNRPGTPPLIGLVMVCGPADDASPCLTITLPDES